MVFEVLAEPNRRRILDVLMDAGERPVGDLVAELGVSQPAVSKHLRILRDAGLVEVRADGRRRLYSARPEGLTEVETWLEPYRRAWSRRLDALGARLDDLASPPDGPAVPSGTGPAPARLPASPSASASAAASEETT